MTEYQALAEFRYQIRRFLHFSEAAARASEIEPQHHQFLLAVKGYSGPSEEGPTIGYLAERMQVRHHSAVELIDRMVSHGLISREVCEHDRRQVLIRLTRAGERILSKLSVEHLRELRESGPALVNALDSILARSVTSK